MNARQAQQRAVRRFGTAWLRLDEPMSARTSFRVGGPALIFAEPPEADALRALIAFGREESLPLTAIGRGTNLLVSDSGVPGIVLRMGRAWDWLAVSGDGVEAGAGCPLPQLARHAALAALSGLEFAAGIPGSVGGAVAMNAGAWGGSMAGIVRRVECVTPAGEPMELTGSEMAFAYRHSRVLAEGLIVTRVHLALQAADAAGIRQKMDEYQAQRKVRQPLSAWSAGSVFRNPPGDAAGRLIEAAGCKGLRAGDALVSPKHANFIVNPGAATASDIASLVVEVQRHVWDRFGVWLEPEITLLGEFHPPVPGGPPA